MDATVEPDMAYTVAPWGELGRSATLAGVSLVSKLMLKVLNYTRVRNQEAFLRLIAERPEGVGLITVSNHTSTVDDPALFCAMTPLRFFATEHIHHLNRWTLCAKEYCYKTLLMGQFFQSGKTLPIERGAGPDQPVMRTVAKEVALGRWLHIFPEGRVGYTGTLGPLRWGVGKVICDVVGRYGGRDPIVLPFYHSGMGEVMPKHASIPRVAKHIAIVVGEPVELSDLTCQCYKEGVDQREVWRQITARIGHALKELEAKSPPNVNQVKKGVQELGRRSEDALPNGLGESEAV